MELLIKSEYKKFISNKNYTLNLSYDPTINYKLIAGDLTSYFELLKTVPSALKTIQHKILLVTPDDEIEAGFFKQIKPTIVLQKNEINQIEQKIAEAFSEDYKKQLSILARENVESKRNELEKLNDFLSYQDKERSVALKIFHTEEQSKKNREKQLLFFLDFINSNYFKSSFLDELLNYIWSEIKKQGQFYQLGIILKKENDNQGILFQYNSKKYYSQKNITIDEKNNLDHQNMATILANIYQRPIGKILTWKELPISESTQYQFYLFLETQGKEYKIQELDGFISDRMSILSLIISRWITEESEKSLLRQWRNTFKAYKDPIHVVDEKFNIVQTNYDVSAAPNRKCFELLANRTSCCENCPVINFSKKVVEIKNKSEEIQEYQVHKTEFSTQSEPEKKYYLMFYENITEINKLKSQFIQSEKMNTIGNLANHLAHELNNPLTGLKLATEYLISEIKNNTEAGVSVNLLSDLNEVFKATVRSEMIIKDLVDFSSESAKEMQKIDFSIVLKKTMTLLKSILRSNRIFIDIKSQFVNAQPVYLQQIIFNLIKNACEAMGQNGSVKIYHGAFHAEYSDFIIEDNGPGINENLHAELFKPFFTTKKQGEGTGLGLYLCSSLMKKMSGELIYDSKFKLGSRFILRFKNI